MKKIVYTSFSLILIVAFNQVAFAQKAGASSRITTGKVEKAERVQLDSESGKGALVGGSLGLLSAKGKKSSKKARNTIIGAAAGGALSASAQGSREGMAYSVKSMQGGSVRIVTDQTEIKVGDCVNVEEAGGTANIRRVSAKMCDPNYGQAVKAVNDEIQEEASECAQAKQLMVEAETKEAFELAKMKMELLCSD
ncbi:MAG: hypothetical protein P8Y20_01635 [Gammaproteobacteria bacterium]|jgi:hypothetical protein